MSLSHRQLRQNSQHSTHSMNVLSDSHPLEPAAAGSTSSASSGMNSSSTNRSAQSQLEQLQQQLIPSPSFGLVPPSSDAHKQFQGILLLIICIAVYTLQSVVLKAMNSSGSDYSKPFFVLWLSHSTFTWIIPASMLYIKLKQQRLLQRSANTSSPPVSYAAVVTTDQGGSSQTGTTFGTSGGAELGLWTRYKFRVLRLYGQQWSHFLWMTFSLALLYTFPNYLWYLVLSLTSISEATTIFNTNCVFAYLFSILLFKERVQMVKIVGIVLSVVGICFMAADSGSSTDEDNSTKLNTVDGGGESVYNRMMGNMLTLVAATSYGLYEVLYERYAVGKEKNVFLANQITGFIGFFTFSTQWILLPILSASGWEPFELPSDSRTWLLVFFNALLSFTYNVFFMLSIALAGPVLSSVGLMVTIPLSWIAEYVVWGEFNVKGMSLVGSLFIFAGFGTLIWGEFAQKKQRQNEEHLPVADDEDE